MIFFTADPHFGHANIIKMCNRPFADVEAMNRELIAAWNGRITGENKIYIVGDLFFRCKEPELILQQLKGKKHLIIGNHDCTWMKKVDMTKHFQSVENYLEISDGKGIITLCHYPLLTWRQANRSYMVHGHIHANTDADFWPLICARDNVLNAGVEVNGYRPVTFEEMLENNRKFKKQSILQDRAEIQES